MNIFRDLVLGTGGLNEIAIVRAVRLMAIGIALACLGAIANFATNGGTDDVIKLIHVGGFQLEPSTAVLAEVSVIAGLEKWLRARSEPQP